MKKIFPVLLLVLFASAVSSCGTADVDNNYGSIVFSVRWITGDQAAPEVLRVAPAGVTTVRLVLYNMNMPAAPDPVSGIPYVKSAQQDFPAAAGSGTLGGIAQGNYLLDLEGRDDTGAIVYWASNPVNADVIAGQTADCGVIVVMPYGMGGRTPTGGTGGAPMSPTAVTAAAGDSQVTISWGSVEGATSYNIYWAAPSTGNSPRTSGTKIANVTSPYTHTGLTNGTTYYYIVTAVNSVGESYDSMQVSATPGAAPAAPTGVTAAAGDGQVTISWNTVPSIYQYYLYWSTSPGVTKASTNKLIASAMTPGLEPTYTHSGLTNGTTYYYVVTAVSSGIPSQIESTESVEVSARPLAGAPSPLSGLATNITDTTARLNGTINNPSGYTTTAWFEYGSSTAYGNSTSASAYASSGAVTFNANISGLQQTSTYHYRVVSQNSAGTFYGNDRAFITYQTPQVLASGSFNPQRIAVDSSEVYWTDSWSGSVKHVLISGGTSTILASGLISPYSIAVDAANVYISENNTSTGTIKKIDKVTGSVTTLASGLNSPYAITVDSTHVYWIENTASGSVKKVNISGPPVVETLASGVASPRTIALNASNVFWSEYNSGALTRKISKTGGVPVTLVTESGAAMDASSIAADETNVYWSNGAIKKVGVDGGPVTTLVNGGGSAIVGFDASDLYYFGYDTGYNISKIPVSGGAPLVLLSGLSMYVNSLTMDSASIYWAEYDVMSSTGYIKKIQK